MNTRESRFLQRKHVTFCFELGTDSKIKVGTGLFFSFMSSYAKMSFCSPTFFSSSNGYQNP
jgi:hypothetical protein